MTSLPPTAQQLQHLRDLGLIDDHVTIEGEGLVVVHPSQAPAADLVAHVARDGKPGFVVPDLTDVGQFAPIDGVEVPHSPVYLAADPQRGDEMSNWSPDEALPAITGAGRSPMTIHEGLSWLLQQPGMLDRNHCFMTIGSRKAGAKGLDKRTPAIWISNGVERDGGRERRNSAKLGWCWAGNRHTWLGFGSVASRVAG